MKIGIDARPLNKQRTGIGNYVLGLVELLPRSNEKTVQGLNSRL
jgi:hypothetical protein